MGQVRDLQLRAWQTAEAKGFHGLGRTVVEELCLIHSEVSEALEAFREHGLAKWSKGGKPEGVGSEMADTVIRIMDLCQSRGIDLEAAILEKMAYNSTRARLHGGKRL